MSGAGCGERLRLLVQADHDGELSAAEAAEVAAHLDECDACREVQADLASLRAQMRTRLPRYTAPEALRRSLQAQAGQAQAGRAGVGPFRPRRRVFAGGVGVALALAASVVLLIPHRDDLAGEAVSSHIRALQPGHLTDVVSTDQHTVKPWFDGRIDYAPPVRDFAASGFPLVGGRLDTVGARTVASLVYRRDRHLVDVFVWPDTAVAAPVARTVNGYNVVAWAGEGMRFEAVSDLNPGELAAFAALWRAGSTP